MSFFQIKNITKKYGELKVLNDISLSAKQGEFISILGESGSGKTTLLRIISGLEGQFA
ncbi:MAG TPA: putative 2-aminoethylphosphonate ABC transporter ATP-binding protein, partial [Clostridiaceae bacterium]|nr:putative 2-aminoethylphosphonate ABC transporter ATP-binding protein [Clostridiaceae bacterium]